MAEQPSQTSDGSNRVTVTRLLPGAFVRVVKHPRLVAPFFLAGVVLSLVDRLHALDPIPEYTRGDPFTDGLHIRIQFTGYPTGVSQREALVGSLLELEAPYFFWAVGLQAVVWLVLTVAVVLALSRVLHCDPAAAEWLRAFGYIALLDTVLSTLGGVNFVSMLFDLVALILLIVLFVRLFAVPGLLVQGHSLRSAITQSCRQTNGHSLRLLVVVVSLGLTAWLLSFVPYAGTLVSTALVAPVHAVAIGTFLRTVR